MLPSSPTRWYRRLAAGLAAAALVAAACHGGAGPITKPQNPPPELTGRLRTEGTRIVGPKGKTIRLIGVNLQGLQFSNDDGSRQPDQCGHAWKPPPRDAPENIASWGFNVVRLPIGWANLEPEPPTRDAGGNLVHHWSEDYLKAIDATIAALHEHHIAVILDPAQFHWSSAFKESGPSGARIDCEGYGMPAWLNPRAASETLDQAKCDFIANRPEPGVSQKPWDGLAAVWTLLGKRYADDPAVVAADTFNEPYFRPEACSGPDFQGFFKTMGSTIRSVAPRWLLIFEYFPPAVPMLDITSPPPFDDSIYSLHVYAPNWDAARELMEAAWSQAQRWRMPLFVGEFDAFGATRPSGGRPDWPDETKAMLSYMKDRDISWTVFGYFGGLSLVSQSGQPKADIISTLQTGF